MWGLPIELLVALGGCVYAEEELSEILQTPYEQNVKECLFTKNSTSTLCTKLIWLYASLPQPRVSQEDCLTYAELELVRPRPEPPASSNTDPTPSSPDTVYAQILFQEKQL